MIERLRQVQAAGIERIFGAFGFPGLPQWKVLRSIELFCTEVLPHFRAVSVPRGARGREDKASDLEAFMIARRIELPEPAPVMVSGARWRTHTMSDYDTDFYAWAQQQAQALRAQDWGALDLKHLAEEVG